MPQTKSSGKEEVTAWLAVGSAGSKEATAATIGAERKLAVQASESAHRDANLDLACIIPASQKAFMHASGICCDWWMVSRMTVLRDRLAPASKARVVRHSNCR